MALTIRLTDPTQIDFINAIVHDAWFEIGEVVSDPEAAVLQVPFHQEIIGRVEWLNRGWGRWIGRVPVVQCILCIEHVNEFTIHDTERIGTYQINKLRYDPQDKHIQVTTTIPLEFVVGVTAFSITVEQTDEVIGERTIHRFLCFESMKGA